MMRLRGGMHSSVSYCVPYLPYLDTQLGVLYLTLAVCIGQGVLASWQSVIARVFPSGLTFHVWAQSARVPLREMRKRRACVGQDDVHSSVLPSLMHVCDCVNIPRQLSAVNFPLLNLFIKRTNH